jgi:hypothetical protein
MPLPSVPDPTRPAAQASGQEAIETTVDPPPAAVSVYRRPPPVRLAPRLGVRAEVRPWGGGAGQDVALELLDLSELGIRVRLRLPARVSDRFHVTVRDPDGRSWLKGMAAIGSSARSQDGTVVAMLTFGQRLLPHVVRALGGEPAHAPEPSARV